MCPSHVLAPEFYRLAGVPEFIEYAKEELEWFPSRHPDFSEPRTSKFKLPAVSPPAVPPPGASTLDVEQIPTTVASRVSKSETTMSFAPHALPAEDPESGFQIAHTVSSGVIPDISLIDPMHKESMVVPVLSLPVVTVLENSTASAPDEPPTNAQASASPPSPVAFDHDKPVAPVSVPPARTSTIHAISDAAHFDDSSEDENLQFGSILCVNYSSSQDCTGKLHPNDEGHLVYGFEDYQSVSITFVKRNCRPKLNATHAFTGFDLELL